MLRAVKILRMLRGEEMKDLWRTDEGHVEERLRTWIGEIIMSSSWNKRSIQQRRLRSYLLPWTCSYGSSKSRDFPKGRRSGYLMLTYFSFWKHDAATTVRSTVCTIQHCTFVPYRSCLCQNWMFQVVWRWAVTLQPYRCLSCSSSHTIPSQSLMSVLARMFYLGFANVRMVTGDRGLWRIYSQTFSR